MHLDLETLSFLCVCVCAFVFEVLEVLDFFWRHLEHVHFKTEELKNSRHIAAALSLRSDDLLTCWHRQVFSRNAFAISLRVTFGGKRKVAK